MKHPLLCPLLLALPLACTHSAPSVPTPVPEQETPHEVPITSWPLPTENWLSEDAESTNKERRKAWFRELHRTPPDVDWKAIELRNGLDQLDKRNAIARTAAAGVRTASPWVERGSDNQAGRMHVAVYSTDGGTLYAGSSKGGVWKGNTDGTGWTPIGDNLYGGAHWLAVVSGEGPGAPDVVLAAQDGGVVRVTRDDGATWESPAGLPTFNQVRRVLVSSDGSETVFLVGRAGTTVRLYRSTDRMASFTVSRVLGSFRGDVWTPRTSSTDVYTTTALEVLKSTDLGLTWSAVGTPPAGSGELELTGSEEGGPRLWGVFSRNGAEELHRSDDEGASWTYLRDLTDYWGSLGASILDRNLFAYGGVEVWVTRDGGASFNKVNGWAEYYGNPAARLHADIPGIDVWPTGPPGMPTGEHWFVSTDGGLFESADQLLTVNNLSLQGLRVSQYYSTHTSNLNPEHVLAGAQDQGYQRADAPARPDRTSIDFDQRISGDYGHITSGDGSHRWVFSTYPGFILAHVGEDTADLYQVSFPAGEQYAWLPPVVAANVNIRNFFFCATRLWWYEKVAGAQRAWTSRLRSQHNFQTEAGEYLSAFTWSPPDLDRAYAATNRGRLYYSTDRAVTWTQSMDMGPAAHYFYGTAILASRSDPDTVWVAGSGYGVPAVYKSTDGGVTFQPHGEGLPATLVYCLAEAPDGSGDIFCGTETSAYRRRAGAPAWEDITGADAPVTTYWSAEAHPVENTIRFGTYGRGIWDYQIDPVARTVQQNGSGVNAICFRALTPPQLGGTLTLEVDASGHPGATATGFVVYADPSSGTFINGSELLVDLTSDFFLSASQASSGAVDTFSPSVPADPSLAGVIGYAQAFVVGGTPYELCNRLELVVGN